MSAATIIPAILIGGAGTRLWPLSRGDRPKQFLSLTGGDSLFQETVRRFDAHGFGAPWLLTNAETLHHARRQLGEMGNGAAAVIIEPAMRGTAAALAALALLADEVAPEALILAAPADHIIKHPDRFRDAVRAAAPLAAAGFIVTFGIRPTAPETGFGYIRAGQPIVAGDTPLGFAIDAGGFLEKPTLERAEAFVRQGHLWNAGIFLFSPSTLIGELRRHAPATVAAAALSVRRGVRRADGDTAFWHLDAESFAGAPADLSIDNAVMELTDRAAVVPCEEIGWSDVGSLSALWDIAERGDGGNAVYGDGLVHHATGSLVHAHGGRKVVVSHVSDLIVVDTDDCVVVMPRERAQEVRAIVKSLKAAGSPEVDLTREAVFDWGRVRALCSDEHAVTIEATMRRSAALGPRRVGAGRETWVVTEGRVLARVGSRQVELEPGASLSLRRGESVSFEVLGDAARCTVVLVGAARGPLGEILGPLGGPHMVGEESEPPVDERHLSVA